MNGISKMLVYAKQPMQGQHHIFTACCFTPTNARPIRKLYVTTLQTSWGSEAASN